MSANINFKIGHFTLADGYFYMFDDDTNVLFQRTADSCTSFSFPLDNILTSEVLSLEYDGVNYWTLEQSAQENITIRRWVVDNYVCKQQQIINLNAGFGHKYESNAFTVEHYHTTLSGSVLSGSDKLPVLEYWDKMASGMTVTIGPNSNGLKETINVQGYIEGNIVLADPLQHSYLVQDKVQFYTKLWVFNNFDGEDANSAALYKFNAYNGSYITRYAADAYKDVTACTFYKIISFVQHGPVDTLCYVKGTNILFINVSDTGLTLPYYGSMVIDNVHENDTELLPVYDLAIEGDNIYKLQKNVNIFGETEKHTLYTYHIATQTSMVTSVSLLVNPSIIAANGLASTNVIARVKDQFFQPIAGRLVYFGHDDPSGGEIVGGNPVNTDGGGEAGTIYRSGNEAREVKLTATVDQV